VAGVEGTSLFGTEPAAQTSQVRARDVPMFEVDPSWPKVPAKWKLGDASSISIDAQGNAWVLHRPRTLKPDQAAMAAPRVIVFDADTGAFKRMWGAFGNKPVDDDNCQAPTIKSFSDPGPQNFSIVHAIRVANDGTVYVADREYRRVQMFTNDGKFVKQLV